MKEVELQTQIKLSVREQGGYCIKLSNQFSVGIPDLLIALPPFAPCLVEVKWLGPCVAEFDRQIGVTKMQTLEMEKICEPYQLLARQALINYCRPMALILVGLEHRNERRLVALPKSADRLTAEYEADPHCFRKRGVDNKYDIGFLFNGADMARIAT